MKKSSIMFVLNTVLKWCKILVVVIAATAQGIMDVTSFKRKALELPLRQKLYLVFAVFLIAAGAITFFFFRESSDLRESARMVNVSGSARFQMYRILYLLQQTETRKDISYDTKADIISKLSIYVSILSDVEKFIAADGAEDRHMVDAAHRINVLGEKWLEFEKHLVVYLTSQPRVPMAEIGRVGTGMVEVTDGLVKDIENHHSNRLSKAWFLILFLFACVALFVVFTIYVFINYMINPLRNIERYAERIGRGDFSARLDYEMKDEIGTLVGTMNKMTAELESLYSGMEKRIDEKTRQLVSIQKLATIGYMAAGVAHEINNPLATIQVCAESLLRRLKKGNLMTSEEYAVLVGYLKIINEEVSRCGAITGGLLDFSKNRVMKKDRIDVRELIQDASKTLLLNKKYAHGCSVDYSFWNGSHTVLGDEEQIRRVFLNIMSNGFDAMECRNIVSVSTFSTERLGKPMLAMRFLDRGAGISPEDMDKIFAPFFTTKIKESGTGLGLAISERIVSAHGGLIEVESDYGKGTAFTVMFPLLLGDGMLARQHNNISLMLC